MSTPHETSPGPLSELDSSLDALPTQFHRLQRPTDGVTDVSVGVPGLDEPREPAPTEPANQADSAPTYAGAVDSEPVYAGSEPRYSEPAYAAPEHAGHAAAGSRSASYDPAGYDPAGYDPAGYDPAGYAAAGHAATGYDPAGYAAAGYAAREYAAPGYAAPGYAEPVYSEAAYSEPAYTVEVASAAGPSSLEPGGVLDELHGAVTVAPTPLEQRRTQFWQRDALLGRGRSEDLDQDPPTVIVDSGLRRAAPYSDAASARPIYSSASGAASRPRREGKSNDRPSQVTRRHAVSRDQHPRRSKALIVVAALCGLGGAVVGVSAALTVGTQSPSSAEASAPATTSSVTSPTVAAAPIVAEPIVAEPIAAEPSVAEPSVAEPSVAEPAAIAAAPLPSVSPSVATASLAAAPAAAQSPAGETPLAAPVALAPAAVIAPSAVAPPSPDDLLTQAREALEARDVDAAQAAVDRVLAAGLEPSATCVVEAELSVLRGDGELAVARLRELTTLHSDPALWIALGRTLVQAEHDDHAARAFRTALELDPQAVDAHLELAHIRARSFALAAARRHLRDARRAAEAMPSIPPRIEARLLVADGVIRLEGGRPDQANRAARDAQSLDPRSSEAALLLARIALATHADPIPHLRAAVGSPGAAPVALGMLASRVEAAEACELAARYLDRAPRGFDAPAMRRLSASCEG